MVDNVGYTPGAGATVAADEIGGVLHQRVKISQGADGSAADVSSAAPLQVTLANTGANTNKLLVTPDANSAVNIAQMNGVTTTMGNGASGTGVQRVTIADNSTGTVTLANTNIAGLINPGLSAAVSVTRTNDTNVYGANDVLGSATGSTAALDFNLGAISASNIMITSVAFERDASALISGETSYNLHLYNITPPSALGDNTVHDLPSGDRASYLGVINLGVPVDLGSTLYVEQNIVNKQVKLAGTHIFGYLVTVGTYTPTASAVHVVTINAVQL